MHPRFNTILRTALLASRWGMAPFCLGLIAALLIVLAEFFRELAQTVLGFAAMGGPEVIVAVLKLVDLVLVANLVVMIIGAGVEIFLPSSRVQDEDGSEPPGIVDFAALKLRAFASISAIAAIDVLENFLDIDAAHKSGVLLEIAMLLAFVVSGVLLALMDRLAADRR
jgi:uncharacterized protein (TIGR00645 family)